MKNKYRIQYFGCEKEAELIKQFLEWQGYNCKIEMKPNTLALSKGHPAVFLFYNEEQICKGFFETVRWFENNGFVRC